MPITPNQKCKFKQDVCWTIIGAYFLTEAEGEPRNKVGPTDVGEKGHLFRDHKFILPLASE